jgi:CubicO group peptidase (beta-lactamase class C family)
MARMLLAAALAFAWQDSADSPTEIVRKWAEDNGADSFVVSVDGKLVIEWYSGGKSRKIESMSATKSIVSLAVGLLLDQKKIRSLDQPLSDFFHEWKDVEKKKDISIRHILAHTSGIQCDPTTQKIYASPDFVKFALESELESDPGAKWKYNNKAINLIPALVQRAADQRMDKFLEERLFAPLGIKEFSWSRDRAGNPHGMSGLQIHAADLEKIGRMVLDGGLWEGKRIVSKAWIEESMKPIPQFAGYGLSWWLIQSRDGPSVGFAAAGYLGQYIIILPKERIIAVQMSLRGTKAYKTKGAGEISEIYARLKKLAP